MTLLRVVVARFERADLVKNDPKHDFHGAKVAVISDNHVLTLLRDDFASIPFPDMWDFPGGGREGSETPQDCVLRELFEEFGLHIKAQDLTYSASRDGVLAGQPKIWFFGAVLDRLEPSQINFGTEGQRWKLMPVNTYLTHPKAITHLQDGLRGFLAHLDQLNQRST